MMTRNAVMQQSQQYSAVELEEDEMKECTKCHNEVDELAVFPGGVCLECWKDSPEGRYMPTAQELARTWGAR